MYAHKCMRCINTLYSGINAPTSHPLFCRTRTRTLNKNPVRCGCGQGADAVRCAHRCDVGAVIPLYNES